MKLYNKCVECGVMFYAHEFTCCICKQENDEPDTTVHGMCLVNKYHTKKEPVLVVLPNEPEKPEILEDDHLGWGIR